MITSVDQQLTAAIERQSLDEVRAALAAGADPNAYAGEYSMLGLHENAEWRITGKYSETWLSILRALLEAGADPNQSVSLYAGGPDLLIHSLSQFAVLPAIRMLLDFGADPNLLQDGETALDCANADASYTETCELPEDYKGRVLPDYPMLTDEEYDDHYNLATQRWMMSKHQQAYAILRKAGALAAWELKEVPIAEELCLFPGRAGGLFTKRGRPDAEFLARIGGHLAGRIQAWVSSYVDPDVEGYESAEVQQFDYAQSLHEGMAIGEQLASFIADDVELTIYMPTTESIAAGCTHGDGYEWDRAGGTWRLTSCWRDKLQSD